MWDFWELPADDPLTIVTIIVAIGAVIILVGVIMSFKGSSVSDVADEKKPKSKSDSRPFKFSDGM